MNVMFKITGRSSPLRFSVRSSTALPGNLIDTRNHGNAGRRAPDKPGRTAEAINTGRLEECWCCGTGGSLSPIGELAFDNKNASSTISRRTADEELYDELTGIQWGEGSVRLDSPGDLVFYIR